MLFIGDKLDLKQFGGRKGVSTTHYLVEFLNFILYNLDLQERHAVLATMVDFSKAFNKINHNLIISKLADLKVPNWLLKILIGFLKNRKLQVKYKGAKSELKNMPGGGPQGTILGMFLFIVLINPVGYESDIQLGKHMAKGINKRSPIKNIHMKYIDDLTLAESIQLKTNLQQQTDNLNFPLSFHERTGHFLNPVNCSLQNKINEISDYARHNEMVINVEKTKVMLFNTSRKYDFLPSISIDGNTLEVVEKYKLLGLVISSNLKFNDNTAYICKRGFAKLYLLRRLKKLGATTQILRDVYLKQVRWLLEYAVPVWGPLISENETIQIERVQKCALKLIYNTHSYEQALEMSGLSTLKERRQSLCEKFTQKSVNNSIFKFWFKTRDCTVNTRQKTKANFVEVPARTKRFYNSPIPYMTREANKKKI